MSQDPKWEPEHGPGSPDDRHGPKPFDPELTVKLVEAVEKALRRMTFTRVQPWPDPTDQAKTAVNAVLQSLLYETCEQCEGSGNAPGAPSLKSPGKYPDCPKCSSTGQQPTTLLIREGEFRRAEAMESRIPDTGTYVWSYRDAGPYSTEEG